MSYLRKQVSSSKYDSLDSRFPPSVGTSRGNDNTKSNVIGYYAIKAIKQIGPRCIPLLLAGIKKSPNEETRTRMVLALGEMGQPAAQPLLELVELVNSNHDGFVDPETIMIALGKTGDSNAIDRLIELAAKSDYRYGKEVIIGLGKTKSKKAITPLIKILQTTNCIDEHSVCSYAAEALVEITGQESRTFNEWIDWWKKNHE